MQRMQPSPPHRPRVTLPMFGVASGRPAVGRSPSLTREFLGTSFADYTLDLDDPRLTAVVEHEFESAVSSSRRWVRPFFMVAVTGLALLGAGMM